MAADTPYVGTEAAETLASHIQKRLLVADTMPASPAEGQVVLYAGATTASFTQGGIYLYDGEAWNLISLSGELVPSVSYYQKGTVTLTQEIAPNGYASVDVTMPKAMPDTDYAVVTKVGGGFWHTATVHVNATENLSASTFRISIGNPGTIDTIPANTLLIDWQAFKLMTDESRALDEQAIAALQAVVPTDASSTNKLVTASDAELVTVPLSKFQGSSGGAVGYLDLGVNTSTISQAFTLLEVEYGRVDGFIDKYFITVAGASSNPNYIKVVRLTNYGQTPTITLDANKHIWMSMDTYVYIHVKAYGNFSISGTLSRTAPTGTTIPINRLVTENEINPTLTATFAKASGLKSGGVTITGCKKIGENLVVVSGYINKSSVLTVAAYQSNIGSLSISGKTALGSNPTSLFLWSQGQTPQCASCTWKTTGDWMAVPFGDGDATLSEDAWFNAIVRYQ